MRGAKVRPVDTMIVPGTTGFMTISLKESIRFNPLYLYLPVNLKARFAAGSAGTLSLGAGPVFSIGISGKMTESGTVSFAGQPEKRSGSVNLFSREILTLKYDDNTISYQDDSPKTLFRGFDYGVAGFIAYEYKSGIFINMGYQMHFRNINEDPVETLNSRCVTCDTGYSF